MSKHLRVTVFVAMFLGLLVLIPILLVHQNTHGSVIAGATVIAMIAIGLMLTPERGEAFAERDRAVAHDREGCMRHHRAGGIGERPA